MKVAIFTTFLGVDPAYSLTNVVMDQLKMLKRGGYEPVVFVGKGFKPEGIFCDVELKELPPVRLSNEGELLDNYKDEVDLMSKTLREYLKDVEVCITHDIIYQPAHLIHNVAARQIAIEYPNLKWLHWIHSATSPSILCNKDDIKALITQSFPNSFICYPNQGDIPRVSHNFRFHLGLVKHVPHPIDICEYFGFHEITRELVDKYKLFEPDVLMVYPARLDRGKQPHMLIKTLLALKQKGKTAKVIIVDFHSTGGDKVTYRNQMKDFAKASGLAEDEVIFTSDFKRETQLGCPREVVRDLFLLSNVFILPSVSETYSLVAQEAAMCRNLLMLNFDFPPIRSVYGDTPYYYKFSSNVDMLSGMDGDTVTKYDNEEGYFQMIAAHISYELEYNRVMKMNKILRQARNIDAVFRNNFEPLLFARPSEIAVGKR